MTHLTEAELLRQQEVQAKATPGPWVECGCRKCGHIHSIPLDAMVLSVRAHVIDCQTEGFPYATDFLGNSCFLVHARTDWPRLTDWALAARRLLEQYSAGTISDAEMVPKVRQLLGE